MAATSLSATLVYHADAHLFTGDGRQQKQSSRHRWRRHAGAEARSKFLVKNFNLMVTVKVIISDILFFVIVTRVVGLCIKHVMIIFSMDSLSLDESFSTAQAGPNRPLCSSTPRATRNRTLSCPYCDKKYQVQYYYNRHIETHKPEINRNQSKYK
jgi:hypothetical protein